MSGYNLRSRKRSAPVVLSHKTDARDGKSEVSVSQNLSIKVLSSVRKRSKRHGGTNINELPDMILAQIFEKLPRKEHLKVERVCKKWHYVAKNFSWSNYRSFDNYKYRNWPEKRVMKIKPFFDRCGRHLRHLNFRSWSSKIVLSFIRMAPNVQGMTFFQANLNVEFFKKLAKIVPDLKSLAFEALRWDEGDTDNGLIECFKVMTRLEYLYITKDGALLAQHSYVQFPPNLKLLSLYNMKNINQIFNWVAKGCKDLKGLSVLDDINENGFQAISQMKRYFLCL